MTGVSTVASAELYDPGSLATNVTGRGAIDNQGNQVTFNFRASQSSSAGALGYFSFSDNTAGVSLIHAGIRNLSINGNTADFNGTGKLGDGTKVSFTVSVTDNGEPGTSDTISISLTNGYSTGGTLISGDIEIF